MVSGTEGELPVGIAPLGVLARNDEGLVTVTGVQVYRTGLSLDLTILVRKEPGGRSVHEGISRMRWILDEPDHAEDWLWLGGEYADGRGGHNAFDPHSGEFRGDEIFLSAGRSGSSNRRTYQVYWLSPLPPPGTLTFVCTWPRFDSHETKTVIATAPILAAVPRSEVLWPVEPDDPWTPSRPEPVSEWFTQAMREQELRAEE